MDSSSFGGGLSTLLSSDKRLPSVNLSRAFFDLERGRNSSQLTSSLHRGVSHNNPLLSSSVDILHQSPSPTFSLISTQPKAVYSHARSVSFSEIPKRNVAVEDTTYSPFDSSIMRRSATAAFTNDNYQTETKSKAYVGAMRALQAKVKQLEAENNNQKNYTQKLQVENSSLESLAHQLTNQSQSLTQQLQESSNELISLRQRIIQHEETEKSFHEQTSRYHHDRGLLLAELQQLQEVHRSSQIKLKMSYDNDTQRQEEHKKQIIIDNQSKLEYSKNDQNLLEKKNQELQRQLKSLNKVNMQLEHQLSEQYNELQFVKHQQEKLIAKLQRKNDIIRGQKQQQLQQQQHYESPIKGVYDTKQSTLQNIRNNQIVEERSKNSTPQKARTQDVPIDAVRNSQNQLQSRRTEVRSISGQRAAQGTVGRGGSIEWHQQQHHFHAKQRGEYQEVEKQRVNEDRVREAVLEVEGKIQVAEKDMIKFTEEKRQVERDIQVFSISLFLYFHQLILSSGGLRLLQASMCTLRCCE